MEKSALLPQGRRRRGPDDAAGNHGHARTLPRVSMEAATRANRRPPPGGATRRVAARATCVHSAGAARLLELAERPVVDDAPLAAERRNERALDRAWPESHRER